MLGRKKLPAPRGGGLLRKLAIYGLLIALGIGLLSAAAPWVDHLWDPTSYANPNTGELAPGKP